MGLNAYPMPALTSETLAAIIAQIVQFSRSDYNLPDCYPDDVRWNAAYVCACFVAQHTVLGDGGVDTAHVHDSLRFYDGMEYPERLALVLKLVEEHGGVG